jgi:type IV pilus assembly protein PilM
MAQQPGVWGIDLGQCALKALRLQMIDDKMTATAFDYIEYPKILSQPDADPDQLTREALEQFLQRTNLRGDQVAISVPGQSGLARFVKLPPVEEKKIADIVKFEAKQQIPFNLDEVVWDYQKIGAGNVVDGFALETEIGLFAMKRDQINRSLAVFQEVGIEVHIIQMAPLALCNFVAWDLLDKNPGPNEGGTGECVVALDIGTDASNLVITDGGKVIWQRPVGMGGNHFTRALTKELKLTFAKAEHLKRNATKSPPEFKKIMVALKPVFNDFVGEVQRSLGYFSNTHRDAQISYMIGLGNAFRLPVLQKFLAEKLNLEVRKLEGMRRLEGADVLSAGIYTENILSFAVAYGLALQGLTLGRVTTNLLPGELRTERLIRAKKPWAVAAASLLVLGLGAAAAESYLSERPYSAQTVLDAEKAGQGVVSQVTSLKNEFDKVKKEALDEEKAVKAIVAGQAERLNWLKLVKFISEAVPQPDGTSLPPEVYKRYMEAVPTDPRPKGIVAVSGKRAYELYQQRLREGSKPPVVEEGKEVDPLPPGIDDLVQFQIESIDARFCDDLKTFWNAVTRNHGPAEVRPNDHHGKLPEGQGWVVELKGYTYHHASDVFIRETLLTRIAQLGIKTPTPATTSPPGTPPAPVPPPPPGATPPGTPPAKDAQDTKEPVVDRISHVVLQDVQPITGPGGFNVIGKNYLDSLLAPPMPAGEAGERTGRPPVIPPSGAMGGDTPPGATTTGPSRSGWTSLGGVNTGPAGVPGAPGAPGAVRSGEALPPGGFAGKRTSDTRPPMPSGVGVKPATTTTPTTSSPQHKRTEFAILFIWREPTPSDSLRGTETPGGGPPGIPPGMPPGIPPGGMAPGFRPGGG